MRRDKRLKRHLVTKSPSAKSLGDSYVGDHVEKPVKKTYLSTQTSILPPDADGRRMVFWLIKLEGNNFYSYVWKHVGWLMPEVT